MAQGNYEKSKIWFLSVSKSVEERTKAEQSAQSFPTARVKIQYNHNELTPWVRTILALLHSVSLVTARLAYLMTDHVCIGQESLRGKPATIALPNNGTSAGF